MRAAGGGPGCPDVAQHDEWERSLRQAARAGDGAVRGAAAAAVTFERDTLAGTGSRGGEAARQMEEKVLAGG